MLQKTWKPLALPQPQWWGAPVSLPSKNWTSLTWSKFIFPSNLPNKQKKKEKKKAIVVGLLFPRWS